MLFPTLVSSAAVRGASCCQVSCLCFPLRGAVAVGTACRSCGAISSLAGTLSAPWHHRVCLQSWDKTGTWSSYQLVPRRASCPSMRPCSLAHMVSTRCTLGRDNVFCTVFTSSLSLPSPVPERCFPWQSPAQHPALVSHQSC